MISKIFYSFMSILLATLVIAISVIPSAADDSGNPLNDGGNTWTRS